MKKLLALLLAILMVTAMFTGCTKDEDNYSKKSSKKSSSAKKEDDGVASQDKTPVASDKDEEEDDGVASQDKTPVASDKDEEEDDREIVVGYTIYAPMNYMDDNGNLVGFDTELAKAVFEAMGYTVSFKEIDWSKKYDFLNDGTVDCVWNGFEANYADDDGIARSEKVDFSYYYVENQQVVVARKDSGIKTAADLNGKIGAAEFGSAGESYGKTFEGAVINVYTAQTDYLFEVLDQNVAFAIVDAQLAKSCCGTGDYADLEIIEALSSDAEYCAVGFKKNSTLTEKVNKQLEKLAKDGTIAVLAMKYNVPAITDFSDQKK